jgi:hypothetical protein
MIIKLSAASAAFSVALLLCCGAQAWDQDPFAQYLQRSPKVTLSAGNASAVNTATHVIDPWPPYVGNRRIPGNGERMAGAVQRYQNVYMLPLAPRPIFTPTGGGGGGGGGAGAGAGTPPAGR